MTDRPRPSLTRWVAAARIPRGDLTLYSGNGGGGETETAMQLLVAVAAGLGDWLACVVEAEPQRCFSAARSPRQYSRRIERTCRHRRIDPHAIDDLHLHFPDLECDLAQRLLSGSAGSPRLHFSTRPRPG
jgi:RecA-family ATPase